MSALPSIIEETKKATRNELEKIKEEVVQLRGRINAGEKEVDEVEERKRARPESISNDDIKKWSKNSNNDKKGGEMENQKRRKEAEREKVVNMN